MGFESNCVVIKFNDKEKYAAQVCSGKKDECILKAAYFRGLFHELKEIQFGIYEAWHIDALVDMERAGKGSLYELLNNTSTN